MEMGTHDIGSMVRLKKYLQRFLPDTRKKYVGWTNICFFRTPTARELPCEDIALCVPVFLELMDIISPSAIISVSDAVRKHLKPHLLKETRGRSVPMGQHSFTPIRAVLARDRRETPILFLPHPARPMRRDYRDECWAYCFSNG